MTSVTVKAFLEGVVLTKVKGQMGNVAQAYVLLEDDADGREFKVAIPRDFAKVLGDYLATWDDVDETPRINITFTIPDEEEE